MNKSKIFVYGTLKNKYLMIALLGIFLISFTSAFNWNDGSLVSYYNFNDITKLYDLTTNNTKWGTPMNSPTLVTGILGNAYNFSNSADSYVNLTGNLSSKSNIHTMSFWVNSYDSGSAIQYMFDSRSYGTTNGSTLIWDNGSAIGSIGYYNGYGGASGFVSLQSTPSINAWHHLVFIINATTNNVSLWVDGVYNNSASPTNISNITDFVVIGGSYAGDTNFNGSIDEFGIWNRSLSQAEITELYNGGYGLGYTNIELESPVNYYNSTTLTNYFTASMINSSEIKNVSLVINGSVVSTNTSKLNGSYNISYTLNHSYYSWSIRAYDSGNNAYNSETRYITVGAYKVNNVSYDNTTLSGSTETFTINTTYDTNLYNSINIIMNYNNTNYTMTTSDTGSTVVFSKTIAVPIVTADINKTFYFFVVLSNSTNTYYYNTSSYNQTVKSIAVDSCSSYTNVLLNFTMMDEQLMTKMNGTIEITLSLYTFGTTTLVKQHNATLYYWANNDTSLCINDLNSSYSMGYTIKHYGNSSYFTKYRNIQNFTMDSSTLQQNITLYNLLSANGNTFEINIVGNSYTSGGNLLIDIQKYYVGLGKFISVESPVTNTGSVGTGHLITSSEVYNFIVSYYGKTLGTFNNYQVVCQNPSTAQCSITLNLAQATGELEDFTTFGNLDTIYLLNNLTRVLTLTFTTVDGNSHNVSQIVFINDGKDNTTICGDSITGTSGTFTCTIPLIYQNTTFFSQVYSDGELVGTKILSFAPVINYFGADIYIELLMFSCLVLLMISNPILMMIGGLIGILCSVFLLFLGGGDFTSILATIIWYIVAGVIIVWQIGRKN